MSTCYLRRSCSRVVVECSYEKEALPAGWTVGAMAAAEGQPLQLQVQVRCSVMADLDGTRLNALCLVGWSFKTRAEKGKREESIGAGKTVRRRF